MGKHTKFFLITSIAIVIIAIVLYYLYNLYSKTTSVFTSVEDIVNLNNNYINQIARSTANITNFIDNKEQNLDNIINNAENVSQFANNKLDDINQIIDLNSSYIGQIARSTANITNFIDSKEQNLDNIINNVEDMSNYLKTAKGSRFFRLIGASDLAAEAEQSEQPQSQPQPPSSGFFSRIFGGSQQPQESVVRQPVVREPGQLAGGSAAFRAIDQALASSQQAQQMENILANFAQGQQSSRPELRRTGTIEIPGGTQPLSSPQIENEPLESLF